MNLHNSIAAFRLTVAPTDIPIWRVALNESPDAAPEYAMPNQSCPWWLIREDFLQLELHSPAALTGHRYGWIGVAPATGKIFVYAFTM